ncbi:MAG: acylphosphatase [Acidobacteria bacterium]|nr:MAG: acylphosphatase [Acidobacteriota bacterium]
MATARFEVYGRVQGVGFRYFAQRQALALEVRGWVRNRDDRTVEVHAAGSAKALQALEDYLRQGPPAAYVTGVSRSDWPLSPAQGAALDGFKILD